MADNISTVGFEPKQQRDNGNHVFDIGSSHFGNNILPTLKKNKMATAKVTWFLFHLLGVPCFLLSALPPKWFSLLDINVADIPQPYKTMLWILAVLYMITVIARSLEKWHHMHLRNREHRTEIKKKELSIKKGIHEVL